MQTVLVKKGCPSLGGRLEKDRAVVQRITHRYISGRVRTSSGDTWEVQPHAGKEADFIAVR